MAAIFHLRRIGPEATRPESSRVICFTRTLTMIGRSAAQVDYVICSADFRQNAIVSRRHCRVRRQGAILLMLDDSRNGVYINDVKINGQAELYEGDTVVFGHPNGERLAAGVRVRQPDSEYQFILERCRCQRDQPQRPEPEQPDVQARVMPPPATAPNTAPAAASKPAPEPEVAPDVAAASTSSATLDQVPIKQDPPKAAMEKTDSVETATEMPQESVTDDSTVNAVESHKEVEVQPKEIEDPSKRLKDSPKELADLPNETKEPQMELEESSNSTEEPPKETESFSKATQDSNMKDDAPIEDTVENVDLPNVIDAPRVIDTSESIEGSSNQGTDLQDDEPKGVEDSTSSGDKTSLADRPESDVTEQSVEQQNATPFTSESEVVQGHNEVNSMDFGQSRTDVNTNTDDIQINQDVQMTDTSQENTTPTTSESEVVQSHEGVNPMDVGQSSIDINTNSDDNQTNPDVHLIGTPQDTVAPSENHQLDQPAENQMLQGVPVIEILPEVQDIEMLEAVQEGTADHQMSESETMNSRSAANASTVVNESPVVNSAESNESAQSEAQEAQPQPNLSEVDPMRIDQPTDVETPHNDQSAAQDHPILAPTEAVDQQPLDQSEAVDQQPLDQSAAVDQLPLYQSEVQDPPQHDQAEAPQLTEEHLRTSDIPSGTDEVCIAVPSPSTIDSRPEPVCDTAVVPFDSPQGKVVQSPYPASSGATSSKTSVCDSKVCELEGKPAAALSSEVTQNPPQPEESPEVAVESQQKPKPGSSVDEVSNVQIRSVEISREMDTFEETPKAKEVSDEPSEEASDVQKVVSSPKETISEEPIVSLLVVESVNDVEFESPELQCEEEPGSPVVPLVNSNLPSLRGQPAASDEIEVEMSKEMIQSTTPSTEVPLCPNPIEACPTATEESPKVDIVMKFQQKPELEASIVEESEERSRDFESSEEKDVLEETLPSKEQDISEKPFNLHEEKETTSMESQSEEERKSSVAKSAEPLCDPAIYDETCETEMSFASPQKTTPITSVDKESDVLSKEDGNDSYEKVPTLELDHQDVTDEQPIRHESSDNVSSVDESQSREIIKSCENEPALANNEMDVEMEPPEVLNEPGSPIVPLVESNLPLVLEELKATVQMEDTEKVNSEHVPQCDQDVVKSLEISGVGNSQEEAEADSLHETNRLAVIQESLTQTASVTVNLNENIKELKTDSNIKLTTVSEEADFAIANRVPERTVKSHESISCDNIATCRSKDKVEPVVQLGTSDDVSIQGNSETRGSLLNKNELHVQTEEGNKPNESAKVEAVETSSVILETLDHSPEAEQQSVMTADPTSEEIEVAVTADIEKDVDNEMDFESDQIETNGKVESTPENSIIENTDLNKDQNLGEQESEPKEIEQSSQKSTLTASNEVVSVSDVLPENENFEEKASNSTETTGDCLKTSANEIPIAACNEQVIAEQAIDDSVVKPPTNVNNSEENTVLEEDQQRSSDAAKICQLQLDDDKPNTNEDPIITESTPITDSVPVFDVQIETNSPIAVLSDDFLSLKSQTPVKEVNIDVVGEKNEESMQTDSENVACLTEDLSKIEHANEESEKELQRSNHQPLVVAIPNNSGDANKIMDDVAEAERVCPLEVKVDKNGPIPSLPDDFLVKNDDEGACHAKSTKGETPDQQTKETEKGNLESTFCQIEIVDLDAHNKAEHFRKECENELNILKNQPAEVVNDHLLAEENTTARKLEINIERNCAIQVLPDDVLAIAVDKNESASQQGSEPVPDDEPTEADECSKQMESTFCVEVASSLDDKVKTQHFREECEKELLSLRVQTIAQSTCPSTGEDEAFSSLQTVGKADIVEETKIEDKEVEQENSLAINVELNSPMPALPEDFLTVAQQEKNTEVLEETFIEVVASTSPEEEEKVRRFREECEKDLDHLKNQPSEADAGNSYLCPNELVETSVEEKVEASVENPSVEIDEQTATNDAPIGSLPVQNCDNTLEVKVDMNSPIPALPDDFLSLKNSEVKCEKDPELETTFACDVLATSPEAKEMIKQHREKWKQDLENLEKQPLNFESNLEVEEILRKVKTRGNDIETGHAKELKVAIKAESKESQEKDGPTMKIHDLPKSSTPSASPVITDLTEDIPMVSPVISEDEMVKLPMSPVPSTSRNILSNLSPSVARHSKKRVQLCLSPIRSPVSRTSYPVSPLTSSAKKFPVKSFTPMPSKLSRQMTLDDSPMSSPTSKKLRPHLFISPGPSANKKRLRNSDEQSPSKRTRFDVPLFLATGMGSACSSPGVLPRLASLVASPASGSSPSSYIHSLLSQKLVSESDDEDIEEHQFSDAEENDPNCSDVQKEPSSDDSSVLPENKLDQSVAKEPAMSHESCRQSREISTQTSEADPDTYSIVSAKVADNTSTCTPNILVDRPSRESQSLVIDSEPRDCGALKSQNMNDSETVAEQPQDTVVLPLQPQKACQQSVVAQNDTPDVGLDLSEKETGPATDTPIDVPVDAVQACLPLNEDPVSENKTTSEVEQYKPQSPVLKYGSQPDDLQQSDVCEPLVKEAGCSMDEVPTKTDETGQSLLLHESEEQTAEGVLAAEDEKIECDVFESGSKMDDLASQPLMTHENLVVNEDDPCGSKQKILKRKRGSDDDELTDDNKKANRQQSDSAEVVEMPSADQEGIFPNDVQKSCEQSQKESPSKAEQHSINVLSSDSDCEFAMEGVAWIDDDRMPDDKKIESKEKPVSSKSPMVVSDAEIIIDEPHEDAVEDNDDKKAEHSGCEISINALKADVSELADVVTQEHGNESSENDALNTDDEERHSMQLPDAVDSERIDETNQENDVTLAANHTQEDREDNSTKDIPTEQETSMKVDADQTKIVKEDDFLNSTKNPSVEESWEIPDQDAALNDTEILEDRDVGMRRENLPVSTVTENVSVIPVRDLFDHDKSKNNSEQMDTNMVTSEHKEQLGNEDEKSLPIDKTNEVNGAKATANGTQNINTEESMENLQSGIEGLQSSMLHDTEESSDKAIRTTEETSMNVTKADVNQTETVKEDDVSNSSKNPSVEGSSEVPDQDAALNDTEILEVEDVGMRRENLPVPENVPMIPVAVLVDGDKSVNNSEQMDTDMVTSEDNAQLSNSEDERSLATDKTNAGNFVKATTNCTQIINMEESLEIQGGIEQSSPTQESEDNRKNTIPTEDETSKKVMKAEVKHTETVEEKDVSNSTKNEVVQGSSEVPGQNAALDDTVILEDEDVEMKRTKLLVSENDSDDAKNNTEQIDTNMVTSEHNEQISNEDEKSLPIDSAYEENGEETTANCTQNTNMDESLENLQGGIEQSSQMQDSEDIGMEPIQTVEEMSMNVSKADVKWTETVKEDFPNSNKNTIEEENSEVPDQDTAFDNTEILEEDADMNRMKSSESSVTENVLVNPINPVLEDLEEDFFEKLDEDVEENLAPSEPVHPDNGINEVLDKEEDESELIVISTDDTDLDEPETTPADKAELVKEVLKPLIACESQDDEETQDVGGNENLESVDVHHSLGKMQDVELKRLSQSDDQVNLSTSDEDGSFKKLETIRKSKRRTPLKSVAKIQAGTYSTLTQERGLAPTQVFPQGLDVAPRAEKISCSLERPTQIAPVFETIPASAADVTTVLEPTQLLTPLKKPDTLPKESGGNSSEMFLDTDNDSDSLPAVDKIISALEEASDSESKKAEDPLDSTIVITDSSDDEITPYQRCMGEELVGLKKEAPEGAKNSSSSLEMIADSQDSDFELSQMIPIHSSGTKSAGFTQIKPAAFPGDSEETDVMSEDVSPQVSFPRKRKILMKTPEKTKRRISSCDTTECDDSETDKENGPSAHNTPTRSKRCLSLKKRRRTALGFTQSEGHTTEQQARVDTSPHVSDPVIGRVEVTSAEGSQGDGRTVLRQTQAQ